MVNSIEWDKVHHFEQKEFDDPNYPGSGKLMNYKVVYLIDHLREVADCPIIITAAVDVYGEHGHSGNSYHLAKNGCQAVDFYIKTDKFPREQYYYVEKAGFGGIGIYYDWHAYGKLIPIGFHGDTRGINKLQRWVRREGKYYYLLGR